MSHAAGLTPVRLTPAGDAEQVTQLLPGEPVEVLETDGAWARVVAPWQPSSKDPRGYPGWVLADHVLDGEPEEFPAGRAVTGEDLVRGAGAFAGTAYVWGGMTPDGIDCSGLVHVVARSFGLSVPRDAYDQAAALAPVGLDDVRVGDVYFFARPERRVHHVGFVSAAPGSGVRRMLHAPDSGPVRAVVEEPLREDRHATLVGAARLLD